MTAVVRVVGCYSRMWQEREGSRVVLWLSMESRQEGQLCGWHGKVTDVLEEFGGYTIKMRNRKMAKYI